MIKSRQRKGRELTFVEGTEGKLENFRNLVALENFRVWWHRGTFGWVRIAISSFFNHVTANFEFFESCDCRFRVFSIMWLQISSFFNCMTAEFEFYQSCDSHFRVFWIMWLQISSFFNCMTADFEFFSHVTANFDFFVLGKLVGSWFSLTNLCCLFWQAAD